MKYFHGKGMLYLFLTQKNVRIMKLVLMMLTVILFNLSAAESNAQNVRISLKVTESTIKEVLKGIESRSDYTFYYNDDVINTNKHVSLNAENERISDILAVILPNCNFEVSNKKIIITAKPEKTIVAQQGKTVTGIVRDINGEAVIGANVLVKGTTNGVITDMDGKFTLPSVSSNTFLKITYIGYLDQEIRVGSADTYFDVVLREDLQALEEVVVVGYASQKKVNLTGSVASINFEDDKMERPVTTIASSLSGMAAGVNVMNTSSQPNSESASMVIRGTGTLNNSAPLVLVDGMEMSLNEINPNDVSSISILKESN